MEIVISYAFAHIVEAIILWMSMSQMYERRYKNWITGLIMLSGHAVMFGVFLTDNIYVVTTVNNVVYFLLIALLFNISKKVAVFWALIYNAMMALSELTVFYIIQYLVGVCDVKRNGAVTNIIVVCLCKTVFFLFVQVMVLIKNRSNVGKDLYKDDLPIVLFIVSLISSLMVFITYYVIGMNSLISQTEAVALFGNLLSNAFEAAEYCKKDIKPYIEFIVKRKKDFIIIIVRNSAVKAPRKINGRYISSKKDTEKKHGYGMKSIYNIVDKYKGSHVEEYDETKREFTIKIILLNDKKYSVT